MTSLSLDQCLINDSTCTESKKAELKEIQDNYFRKLIFLVT